MYGHLLKVQKIEINSYVRRITLQAAVSLMTDQISMYIIFCTM